MDGSSNDNVNVRDKKDQILVFVTLLKNMVAHFVCILFTAFIIYTAQPGTSKLLLIVRKYVRKYLVYCSIHREDITLQDCVWNDMLEI